MQCMHSKYWHRELEERQTGKKAGSKSLKAVADGALDVFKTTIREICKRCATTLGVGARTMSTQPWGSL
jgi:hypothetical protein